MANERPSPEEVELYTRYVHGKIGRRAVCTDILRVPRELSSLGTAV
jgi:hypothetical protein